MTAEGRLQRGKANYEAGEFLDNQETIDYVATLKEEPVKEEPKEEETKSKKKKKYG